MLRSLPSLGGLCSSHEAHAGYRVRSFLWQRHPGLWPGRLVRRFIGIGPSPRYLELECQRSFAAAKDGFWTATSGAEE